MTRQDCEPDLALIRVYHRPGGRVRWWYGHARHVATGNEAAFVVYACAGPASPVANSRQAGVEIRFEPMPPREVTREVRREMRRTMGTRRPGRVREV